MLDGRLIVCLRPVTLTAVPDVKGKPMVCRRQPAFQPRRQTTIMRVMAPVLLLLALAGAVMLPSRVAAAGPQYFPETGHNCPELFYSYWLAHGGMDAFGLPITETYTQDGLT